MDAVLEVAGDEVMEWLDAEHGAEVSDQRIFREHAEKYEVRGLQQQQDADDGLAGPRNLSMGIQWHS